MEEDQYGLGPLFTITRSIAELSGLDLFSTEIAYTDSNLFVVVDYVNDQPDLRMQLNAGDGVPDFIVHDIVERFGILVSEQVKSL